MIFVIKRIDHLIFQFDGVTFIWFTDGTGWNSARKNLYEIFNELEIMYNIDELENGILKNL